MDGSDADSFEGELHGILSINGHFTCFKRKIRASMITLGIRGTISKTAADKIVVDCWGTPQSLMKLHSSVAYHVKNYGVFSFNMSTVTEVQVPPVAGVRILLYYCYALHGH